MKKILVLTAITAVIAVPASAQTFQPQMYFGVGVGQSKSTKDNFTGVVPGLGALPISASTDDTATSWKVLAGYQFTPYWGLEAQYTDLGKRDEILSGGIVGRASIKADQYSLAGTGKFEFSPGWFVHGKLGVSGNHYNEGGGCVTGAVAVCLGGSSDTTTDLLWGVGLGHTFSKNWSVKGGYESFGKFLGGADSNTGKKITGSNMGFNVIYSF